MKHLAFTVLFFLFSGISSLSMAGDIGEMDSIQAGLNALPDDTSKVNRLLLLAEDSKWTDVRRSEEFAMKALALSQNLDYLQGLANSKYLLSVIYKDSDFKITEELLLESLEHARQLNDSILIGKIYNTIGNMKDNVNETEDAIKYYLQALEIFDALGSEALAVKVYNNLGIIYDNLADYQKALEYYQRCVELNERNGDLSALAINYLNIGYSLILAGDLDQAKTYLDKSYKLAMENGFQRLLAYIYNNFSNYYFLLNDFPKAIDFGKKAEMVAMEQVNLLGEKLALIRLKEAYFESKDFLNAYLCSEKINVLSDSINKYNKLKELDLLEMRHAYETEKRQQQLQSDLLKADIRRKELSILLIIVGAGLAILLFVFIYFNQHNRIRRKNLEQKATLLEKEKLTQQLEFKSRDLEFKNKELTTNVMYLLKKNEFIASISNKLKKTNTNPDENKLDLINNIISELDRSISEDNWTDFEVRFQEVHVGYYNKLSTLFPDLTPNELRLCAFLRLNMTSKEIAKITYQSADSLKTARYRLRKKLGMDRNENLVAFLTKI